MSSIAYEEVSTVGEACESVARDGGRLLAGGTALALILRQGLISDERFISLGKLEELRRITEDPGGLSIGAMVTHHQAATAPAIRVAWPALADMYAAVATRRIRNVATVGGSLAHADPHLDPPVALMALDATVTAQSLRGTRHVRLDELFVDYYETSLEPDEVLTSVVVPPAAPGTGLAALKFLTRSRDDYAAVDVAVRLRLDGGAMTDVRIALGSVGPTIRRAPDAEAALEGIRPDDERGLERAAGIAAQVADPESDVRGSAAYKLDLIRALVPRTIRAAARNATARIGEERSDS